MSAVRRRRCLSVGPESDKGACDKGAFANFDKGKGLIGPFFLRAVVGANLFVVADDFINDEAQEFFGEFRVQLRRLRQ